LQGRIIFGRRTDHDKEASFDHRLAAVLAAVMLSSAVYIAVEANHNCSGEDCAICHQLQVCENLLKSIGLAGAAAVFAAAVRYALCRVIPSCAEVVRTFTLVSLKVKLSD
jgi:hypothetical protein